MKCKSHPSDCSSDVGVCASCLRERLSALIAVQFRRRQAQKEVEYRRKSDTHPPALIFPRSVSPYRCRRVDNDRRFFSSPHIGATNRKKKHKFSFISSLFTSSKSEKVETDPRISSYWFSSIFTGCRKKQSRLFSLDEATIAARLSCRIRDRGMSPEKGKNKNEDYLEKDRSLPASDPALWKQPSVPSARRRGPSQSQQSQNVSVSGLAFCLSPLVRASPSNRHRNEKGRSPVTAYSGEIGFPGETRVSMKPHLSTAASYCANRSRKLADFGRLNHNH